MSTVAIYNGFGQYETKETESGGNEKGITLSHGGVPFWFPFQKVTYIPDYTMREVDHNASTADNEEESVLTYKTFRISGERLAEEMLETQIPTRNSERGIIMVKGKRADSYVTLLAGHAENGEPLTTEVQEIVMNPEDATKAEQIAHEFKERTIQEYFQSKRERLAGGHGQIFPTGLIRVFMNELNVKDIDDVSRMTQPTNNSLSDLVDLLRAGVPQTTGVAVPIPPQAPAPKSIADLV